MEEAKKQTKIEQFLDEIVSYDFFDRDYGIIREGRENVLVRNYIIKCLILLDGECWRYFARLGDCKQSIEWYAKRWEENEMSMQRNLFKSALEYLECAFGQGQSEIKLECLPLLVYFADAAQEKEMEPEAFREWWEFLERD